MPKSIDEILADMEPELARLRAAQPRPADRIPEILSLLQEVWETDQSQDLRFFQFLYIIFGDGDHYHMEDSEVVNTLSGYLKDTLS